jgi:hypothetical protein
MLAFTNYRLTLFPDLFPGLVFATPLFQVIIGRSTPSQNQAIKKRLSHSCTRRASTHPANRGGLKAYTLARPCVHRSPFTVRLFQASPARKNARHESTAPQNASRVHRQGAIGKWLRQVNPLCITMKQSGPGLATTRTPKCLRGNRHGRGGMAHTDPAIPQTGKGKAAKPGNNRRGVCVFCFRYRYFVRGQAGTAGTPHKQGLIAVPATLRVAGTAGTKWHLPTAQNKLSTDFA